jgi:hypothetical protein
MCGIDNLRCISFHFSSKYYVYAPHLSQSGKEDMFTEYLTFKALRYENCECYISHIFNQIQFNCNLTCKIHSTRGFLLQVGVSCPLNLSLLAGFYQMMRNTASYAHQIICRTPTKWRSESIETHWKYLSKNEI